MVTIWLINHAIDWNMQNKVCLANVAPLVHLSSFQFYFNFSCFCHFYSFRYAKRLKWWTFVIFLSIQMKLHSILLSRFSFEISNLEKYQTIGWALFFFRRLLRFAFCAVCWFDCWFLLCELVVGRKRKMKEMLVCCFYLSVRWHGSFKSERERKYDRCYVIYLIITWPLFINEKKAKMCAL